MRWLSLMTAAVLVTACAESEPDADAVSSCDEAAARAVVERFGEHMRDVSLLAPDSIVDRELRNAYAPLVTDDLLGAWLDNPAAAPGRRVSSPWPARIEIRSIAAADTRGCIISGDVVYATSADAETGGAARERVRLEVQDDDGWRISAYAADPGDNVQQQPDAAPSDPAAPPDTSRAAAGPDAADAAAAVGVVQQYYDAINAREFQRAYSLWSDEGAASGQSFDAFVAGYATTTRAEAAVGAPGRIEGAAGSRYVEIPVTVNALTSSGAAQRFVGTYTLRRSVVDGATPDQRRWRIYSATLRAVNG